MDLVVFVTGSEKKIKEINFYGSPVRVKALQKRFGGYSGGDEKVSMFWGKDIATTMTRKNFYDSLINSSPILFQAGKG